MRPAVLALVAGTAGIFFLMDEPVAEGASRPLKIAVLLDWQNIYNGAREAFGLQNQGHVGGNVDPWHLGRLLAAAPDSTGEQRELHEVRVYRGLPDQARDERTYRAFRAQTATWERAGGDRLKVCARKLRYPPRHAVGQKPQEKGVDVWLAIDLVQRAIRKTVDRVVVFSTDTDMVPALELAVAECGPQFIEVAAWAGPNQTAAMLRVPGARIVQRALRREMYDRLHDPTDYNLPRDRRNAPRSSWDAQISAEGRRPRPR